MKNRLKVLRAERDWTQAQLAELSDVPLGTIRDYEQGRRQPLWDVLFKLCKALGVSTEAFAECVGESKLPPRTPRRRPPKATPATPPAEDLEATAKKKPKDQRRKGK